MRRLEAVSSAEPAGSSDRERNVSHGSGGSRFRLPHGKYAFVASVIVAGLVALGAVWPDDPAKAPAVEIARQPITAAATVSEVVDTVVVRASYTLGDLIAVRAPDLEGADPVVTHLGVAVGDRIEEGDVLAVVAGRPLIAAKGPFPMYRTILPNDRGDDVDAVQQLLARTGFLRSEPNGVFGKESRSAYRAFLAANAAVVVDGFSRDGRTRGPSVPKGELVFLPQLPATVTSIDAGVGDRVGEALLHIEASPPELWFDATPEQAALFEAGQSVLLADAQTGLETESTVHRIDRSDAGYRVLFDVPNVLGGDDIGVNLRAIVRLNEGDAVLHIPLAAIQTKPDGSTSVQVVSDGRVSEQSVALGRVAVGRAVIEHGLSEGDRVVVVGWYQP